MREPDCLLVGMGFSSFQWEVYGYFVWDDMRCYPITEIIDYKTGSSVEEYTLGVQ